MRLMLSVVSVLAVLAACSPKADAPAEPAAPSADAQSGAQTGAQATAPAPVFSEAPFALNVSFSPAAAAKLAETGEKVTVDASYYGEPTEAALKTLEPGDFGVFLGEEKVEIDGTDQKVSLTGRHDSALAAASVKGEPRVLVNIYTARKVLEDNILDCGAWDESLPAASAFGDTGVSIPCRLIEE